MKVRPSCIPLIILAFVLFPSRGDQRVVELGPHHRVWQTVTFEKDTAGELVAQTNQFTELKTGLAYFDETAKEWRESEEKFEITKDGYAVAQKGQHKMIVSPVLNDAEGAIDLLTPDGVRLRSTILGLSLYDRITGKSLLIAEVKEETRGELMAPNAVLFRSCFDGLDASVVITYELGACHQDVILHEGLDVQAIADLGFVPETTQLEIWTEFFDSAPRSTKAHVIKGEKNEAIRRIMVDPDIIEEDLDFGAMKMPIGRAFLQREAANLEKALSVPKQWLDLDGRTFLVESLDLAEMEPLMAALPGPKRTVVAHNSSTELPRLISSRTPPSPTLIPKPDKTTMIAMADSKPAAEGGLVLDWTMVNGSKTNFLFRGDETYYVAGTVYLYGHTIIEGGAVVKYTNSTSAQLRINGTIECQTSPYRPAIFTGKDDGSVGQPIPQAASTMTGKYAQFPLYFYNPAASITLEHIKVRNSTYGVLLFYGANHIIRHSQFVDISVPIYALTTSARLQNVLINRASSYAIYGNGSTLIGEHLTINEANRPLYTGTLYLTNSLLVSITNWTTAFYGASNATNTSGSSVFTTMAAGSHYLADSTYRNVGSTAIDLGLLKTLKETTTYPPRLLGSITAPTTVWPQVQRDTDVPDLGAHYWPLDVIVSNTTVSANLTLTNGVAVGISGLKGLEILSGGHVYSEGRAEQLNRVTHLQNVQEQALNSGTGTIMSLGPGNYPIMRFRTTDLAPRQGALGIVLLTSSSAAFQELSFRDCQLRGASFGLYPYTTLSVNQSLINNLIERCSLGFYKYYYSQDSLVYVSIYNNLFRGGSLSLGYAEGYWNPIWYIRDNFFDTTAQSLSTTLNGANYVYRSFNGFTLGTTNSLGGSNNKPGLTPQFEEGPLGRFYYASTWTNLNNAGSRTAAAAGLFHHTTQLSQEQEGTSQVDIGFHYPALAKVRFIGTDSNTKGDWKGVYGSEGFDVMQDSSSYPSYATVTPTGKSGYTWHSSPTAVQATLRGGTGRIAACWYAGSSFTLALTQTDGMPHQLAIYSLDWDAAGREQKIEIKDTVSGTIYDSRTVTNFSTGDYHIWEIVGDATIKVTNLRGIGNVVFSGLFFDSGMASASDQDGDGIPDYVEDSNGNGIGTDPGESNWQTYNSRNGLFGTTGLNLFTPFLFE